MDRKQQTLIRKLFELTYYEAKNKINRIRPS